MLALAVPLLLAAAPGDPAAIVRGPIAARIDTFLTRAAEDGLSGTLLVEKDGAVILHKGYGWADRGRRVPATTRTPYHLGSLAKQFTASAIYQLEARGRLSTADSLAKWFPEAPPDKRGITIDQLLHHTAGFAYLPRGSFGDTISVDSMVHEHFGIPLAFPPGERYQYSSPGYNLLAAIVEKASGRSFEEYLRTEIFAPAGMSATSFEDDTSRWVPALRTRSYSGVNSTDPQVFPVRFVPKSMGAGSVVSTAADLWKWEQAIRGARVLDTEALAKQFAPGPVSSPTSHYGGGWQIVTSRRGTQVVLHGGDFGGFNTMMSRFLDEHATIVVLSNARNAGRGYRDPIQGAVIRFLFGPPPEMPPARLAVDAARARRWRGGWTTAAGDSIMAREREGAIWLGARSQDAMSVLAGSDSTQRAEERKLDVRAAEVVTQLLANDSTALATSFHSSLPDDAHPEFPRFWRAQADSVGGVTGTQVLGTAFAPPAGARTWIRIAGPKGRRVLTLDWDRSLLLNTDEAPAGGMELAFAPETADRLARFDLFAGRAVRLAAHGRTLAAD